MKKRDLFAAIVLIVVLSLSLAIITFATSLSVDQPDDTPSNQELTTPDFALNTTLSLAVDLYINQPFPYPYQGFTTFLHLEGRSAPRIALQNDIHNLSPPAIQVMLHIRACSRSNSAYSTIRALGETWSQTTTPWSNAPTLARLLRCSRAVETNARLSSDPLSHVTNLRTVDPVEMPFKSFANIFPKREFPKVTEQTNEIFPEVDRAPNFALTSYRNKFSLWLA